VIEAEVLVVGAGFAGPRAARAVADAGRSVLMREPTETATEWNGYIEGALAGERAAAEAVAAIGV
jgi:monoamine oxidase